MIALTFTVLAAFLAQSSAPVATPVPSPAPQQASVPSPAPPVAVAGSGKLICRSVTETGTRFSHKVCYTAAQWSQITADSRALADDMQTRGNGYSH